MAKVHVKGRILQILQTGGAKWDYEIAEQILREYGLEGEYWVGNVRVTLGDLHSGALAEVIDQTIDASKSHGKEKLLFRYKLTEFGRERMKHTGLLVEEGA